MRNDAQNPMLSTELVAELLDCARTYCAFEICGLLFHDGAQAFHLAPNRSRNPTREFTLDIEDYQTICAMHVEKPWAIVHSHPGKGAAPSPQDCRLMDALQLAKQDLAMVIVGLKPVEIRCFKKDGPLYALQWVYCFNAAGQWCGPKMGDLIPMKRMEPVP